MNRLKICRVGVACTLVRVYKSLQGCTSFPEVLFCLDVHDLGSLPLKRLSFLESKFGYCNFFYQKCRQTIASGHGVVVG